MLHLIKKSNNKKYKCKKPWEPEYRVPERKITDNSEPGLPAIHSVKKASSLPKELSWGHMPEEKVMLSKTIDKKLNQALEPLLICTKFNSDDEQLALEEMMRIAISPRRFDNKHQFFRYLTEDVVLNINRIVSQSI
jgi:hypothetical protein